MNDGQNGQKIRGPVQRSLFDLRTFNVGLDLKEALNHAAKRCNLSRQWIVDGMNELAERFGVTLVKGNGHGLTLETLEKWLNPADRSRQMPARALPIFCAVVNDHSALEVLAKPLGVWVIGEEDQRLLQWAKAYHQARQCRKIMKQYEPEM